MQKHTGKHCARALLSAICLACAATATQAALVLESGYIRAGVSGSGSPGSNDLTPPRILFASVGMSNDGANDFPTLGIPFEGFYLTADSGNWGLGNLAPGASAVPNYGYQLSDTLAGTNPQRPSAMPVPVSALASLGMAMLVGSLAFLDTGRRKA